MDPPEMSLFTMPAGRRAGPGRGRELELADDAEVRAPLDPHLASTWVDQLACASAATSRPWPPSRCRLDLVYRAGPHRVHHRFEPVVMPGDPTVADQ